MRGRDDALPEHGNALLPGDGDGGVDPALLLVLALNSSWGIISPSRDLHSPKSFSPLSSIQKGVPRWWARASNQVSMRETTTQVMACPGGCINGGGQPIGTNEESVRARMKTLYEIDDHDAIKVSHKNPYIIELYEKYLGKPLGHKSHDLLHTHYQKRDVN
jgi:iron only hydrogenase large subunit-like protein